MIGVKQQIAEHWSELAHLFSGLKVSADTARRFIPPVPKTEQHVVIINTPPVTESTRLPFGALLEGIA
jgi:hypothetical protein